MPSQRDQIRLSSEEISECLARARVVILTSVGRDGLPHPMPMFYGIEDDGAIVMTTYTKSQKIQNLKRDPRCSLLVEDGAQYFELRGLLLYGRAELIDNTDEVMRILAAVALRQGEPSDESDEALAGRRRMASKRTGIRVRPERIVSWDHRKLVSG
jgi:PPOX class probable F420-dependent enzyme